MPLLVVSHVLGPLDCSPHPAPRALGPWDFPGKNAGVGCHFLLQGIFLTQGSNPSPLHWQADSLPLNHQGSGDSEAELNVQKPEGNVCS